MPGHIKKIFALYTGDEMRLSYDRALDAMGISAVWLSQLESLISLKSKPSPAAILMDFDTLSTPWEPELEMVRATFPTVDFIGLSATDTSQTALACLRAGFSDFLLKPVSPEELAWSIGKILQRQNLLNQLGKRRSRLIRSITQISTSTSPSIIRYSAMEHAQQSLGAESCVWVDESNEILATLDQNHKSTPPPFTKKTRKRISTIKREKDGDRTVTIPVISENAHVVLSEVKTPVLQTAIEESKMIFDYAAACLWNLRKYDEVKKQTFIDDLTGLYNSRYLKFALSNAMAKNERSHVPFSVLFIDVDHFKSVNDKHGHLVGSEFLVAIGKSIRNAVRTVDAVFRYGGDEFVVILNDRGKEEAKDIAERVRKQIARRVFVIRGKKIQTTVSIGVSVYPEDTDKADALLTLADEAMYTAKNDNRNAVQMALPERNPEIPSS